jgi:hypothetical protein
MSLEEQRLFREQVSLGKNYLEFGMCGSTLAAIESGASVISVESDRQWIANVQEAIATRFPERLSNLKAVFVDIGRTREWGIPASTEKQHLWSNYFLSVWDKIEHAPDLVLIDGRFRTACFLACTLAVPSGTKIAIHDFRNGDPLRRNYEKVLEFADVEASAGTLYIMHPKVHINHIRLMGTLHSVLSDYW